MTPAAAKRTAHMHSCTTCAATYEDNCADRTANGTCNPCRSGLPSVYAIGRRPQDCCRRHCRLARKDEIKTYRLAGPGPWFICATCYRQFGYDPAQGTP